MNRSSKFAITALAGLLCLAGPSAFSADKVVSQADLNQALSTSIADDNASRATITTLLQRDDVKAMAEGYGLDLRRADSAVSALTGEELKRVSALAASANSGLVGGAQSITISLVAALLIVIIIILVV
jgi:hypothetical protein